MEAVVLGGAGNVGRLFATLLHAEGLRLTGIDVQPDFASPYDTFIECDVTSLNNDSKAAISTAGCVVVCLPESVVLQVLPSIAALMPAAALWVDTAPVKHDLCSALARLLVSEVVSINPLFGPDLGFAGQNVAAVTVTDGPKAQWFLESMRSAGANVVLLTADAHDYMTASVQVATHAVLICFGMVLKTLAPSVLSLEFSTPPYRMLLSLLHRISSAPPHVYWSLQRTHPHAAQVRALFAEISRLFQQLVDANDEEGFARQLQSVESYLTKVSPDLEAIAEIGLGGSRRMKP